MVCWVSRAFVRGSEDSKINNIQKLRILEEKTAIIATVFQAAGQALQGAGNDSATIQGLIRQVQRENSPPATHAQSILSWRLCRESAPLSTVLRFSFAAVHKITHL